MLEKGALALHLARRFTAAPIRDLSKQTSTSLIPAGNGEVVGSPQGRSKGSSLSYFRVGSGFSGGWGLCMLYRSCTHLGLLAAAAIGTAAEAAEPSAPCYDLKVAARVVEQISSEIPEYLECFCMSCPWILDLKVHRVLDGDKASKLVTALSVQHTNPHPRYSIWWLRMNDAGSYNVTGVGEGGSEPTRCPKDSAAAPAYLRANASMSLKDMQGTGDGRNQR